MHLTNTINWLEVIWTAIATFGFFYAIKAVMDALADREARHELGINSGKEVVAQVLVVVSSALAFAFFMMTLAGLGALSIPTSPMTTPWAYVIQCLLILMESSLTYAVWYGQTKRKQVLKADMRREDIRKEAAEAVKLNELVLNTDALDRNTNATEAATEALQHTPPLRPENTESET